MPRGMLGVRDVVKEIDARKNSGGDGSSRNWFRLGKDETAVVRFLEQGEEVKWAWCHEVDVPGKDWGIQVACRDQDDEGRQVGDACPGCEDGKKRKFQGFINLIWRDAPTFKRDEKGRMVKENGRYVKIGTKDQVAVWQAGIMVFEELDGKDATYKGLTSRDFRVKRTGEGLNTKYTIEPADPDGGPQPVSDADKKLIDDKYDFTLDVTPQPYDTWGKRDQGGSTTKPEVLPTDTSPFMKRSEGGE